MIILTKTIFIMLSGQLSVELHGLYYICHRISGTFYSGSLSATNTTG